MHRLIQGELRRIAREEAVDILFAVESGSRAWGFHSVDSDYDVRFVYARPLDWHLRLDDRRDVIERPISGDLDISGWELGKALKLAVRSNAVLPEWLQSPITYLDNAEARAALVQFCRKALTRRPVTWHYLSLLRRQMGALRLPTGEIKLKRNLYAIRPALALRFMRLHETAMPPMDMAALLGGTGLPDAVVAYVQRMIFDKLTAGEMGVAAATDPMVDTMIAEEVSAAEDWLALEGPRQEADHWVEANALNARFSRTAG